MQNHHAAHRMRARPTSEAKEIRGNSLFVERWCLW